MKGKTLRNVFLGLVAILVGIQFVPVDSTNPPVTENLGAEPEVDDLLRRACYDCHSNETRWPMYARVAPVSWLITRHVTEGRKELNFSSWESLPTDRKDRKLEEIAELVESREMPLASYLRLHAEARLTDLERRRISEWANELRVSLRNPTGADEAGSAPEVASAN